MVDGNYSNMGIKRIFEQIEQTPESSDKRSRFIQLINYYLRNDPKRAIFKFHTTSIDDFDLIAETPGGKIAVILVLDNERGFSPKNLRHYEDIRKKHDCHEIIIAELNDKGNNFSEHLINVPGSERSQNLTHINKSILFKSEIDLLIDWRGFKFNGNLHETYDDSRHVSDDIKLRGYQKHAVINVLNGFAANDHGKLIMACGSGKTLTCLRIAEDLVTLDNNKKQALQNLDISNNELAAVRCYDSNFSNLSTLDTTKNILVLMPSISLIRQTLNSWALHKRINFNYAVVCSDEKAAQLDDDEQEPVLDTPVTTRPENLAEFFLKTFGNTVSSPASFNVTFSTYHSLHVINKAQKLIQAHQFDLVICDESHKTAIYEKDNLDNAQSFGNIHRPGFIRGAKTLFTTATPKVYAPNTKEEYQKTNKLIASMDDVQKFGKTFYELTFGQAVSKGILADYKIIIRPESTYDEIDADYDAEEVEFTKKILSIHKSLAGSASHDINSPFYHPPKKTALIFSNTIKTSKKIKQRYEEAQLSVIPAVGDELMKNFMVKITHLDCTSNVQERQEALYDLESPSKGVDGKIITNARILSEGVDVPDLDAVVFFEGRNSQVDVVQSVGRCMRKGKNGKKEFGYVILPVPVNEEMLRNGELGDISHWSHVWKAMDALKSHDREFDITVNKLNTTTEREQQKIIIDLPDTKNSGEYNIEAFRKNFKIKLLENVGVRKIDLRELGEIDQATKDKKGIVSARAFANYHLGDSELREAIVAAIAAERIGKDERKIHGDSMEKMQKGLLTHSNIFHAFLQGNPRAVFKKRFARQIDFLKYKLETIPDIFNENHVIKIKKGKVSGRGKYNLSPQDEWQLLYQMYLADVNKVGVCYGYMTEGKIKYDLVTQEYSPQELQEIFTRIEDLCPEIEKEVRLKMDEMVKVGDNSPSVTNDLLAQFNSQYQTIYKIHKIQNHENENVSPENYQYRLEHTPEDPELSITSSGSPPERPTHEKVDYLFLNQRRPCEPKLGIMLKIPYIGKIHKRAAQAQYLRDLALWEGVKTQREKEISEQNRNLDNAYHFKLFKWHAREDELRSRKLSLFNEKQDLQRRVAKGDHQAVTRHCSALFRQHHLPKNYGTVTSTKYDPAVGNLALEFTYRSPHELYNTDKLSPRDAKQYLLLASTALLIKLRSVFSTDTAGIISSITFRGLTVLFNNTPGRRRPVALIDVSISRAQLSQLNLSKMDPLEAIKYLGGTVLNSLNESGTNKASKVTKCRGLNL